MATYSAHLTTFVMPALTGITAWSKGESVERNAIALNDHPRGY
jgi:hypothetical protein